MSFSIHLTQPVIRSMIEPPIPIPTLDTIDGDTLQVAIPQAQTPQVQAPQGFSMHITSAAYDDY